MTLKKQVKIIKRYSLKTPCFLFLRTENRKHFFIVKCVFLFFCFKEQKTIIENNCQTVPKS